MSGEVMGDDMAGQHGSTATGTKFHRHWNRVPPPLELSSTAIGTILTPGTMQEAPPTETGSEGVASSYNADY